jgi:flagellin
MASVINTNLASLYAQKNLSGAQNALGTAVERLSSGLRINRAKDDAAGLGISQKLTSQIKALGQGIRNANDATSMVQTAEGAMSEVNNILQRMKELSVQARNESLSSSERSYIADELLQLRDEINAIGERTSYNGMSLLKNSLRAQVSSTLASGSMSEGASLMSGLSVKALKVESANTGSYSLSVRNVVAEAGFTQASNVNENPVPTAAGANTARTVSIAQGDVYEGAILSVTVPGASGSITYSAVAGQDDTAATIATKLANSLSRDFSTTVSASSNVITFAATAALGNSDIAVSAGSLQEGQAVANVRSTVDSPFTTDASARTISLNDFDIQEGRKLTVRIGNPNSAAEFSTYVGSGATKESVAQDLTDLISQTYSGVSRSGNDITFAASANMGQADISLTVKQTSEVASDLTISSVSNKYGVATARSLEIVGADVDPGRVFSLSVDGKDYSYKVQTNDTASTVAYALADLLAEDFGSVAGTVSASDVTVSGTQGGSVTAGSSASVAVTFRDLSAGDAFNVGNLTFTANRNVSDSELADAFASISSGGAGNSVAYGSFSGTLTDASGNAFASGVKVQSGAEYSVEFSASTVGTAVSQNDLGVTVTNRAASTVTVNAVTTDGSASSAGQKGASFTIAAGANTVANPSVFTAPSAHGLQVGDELYFSETAGTDTATGTYYVASVPSSTTFTIATAQNNLLATDLTGTAADVAGTFVNRSGINTTDESIRVVNHGFSTGERVVYTTGGTAIGGLTSGATYYVIDNGTDSISLANSLEDAQAGVAVNLTSNAAVGTQLFQRYDDGGATTAADENTTVTISSAGGLAGDQVTIDGVTLTLTGSASGADIALAFKNYLKDGATSSIGSFSGTASGRFTVAMGTNPFAAASETAVTSFTTTTNVATVAHAFVTGDRVLYTEGAFAVNGLVDGQEYYVIDVGATGTSLRLASSLANALQKAETSTVASADGVDVAANTFTESSHGLFTGDRVTYTAGTTAVGGLTTATNYYVIKVDDDTYKLAETQADAVAGNAIDVTSAGLGSQTFARVAGKEVDLWNTGAVSSTVDSDNSGVSSSTDTLTDTDHGLITGDTVVYTAGTTVIGGLTDGASYYVVKVDDDNYKLASTLVNARAGVTLDLTTDGGGDQTFAKAAVTNFNVTKVNDTTKSVAGNSVDLTANQITSTNTGFQTGDMIYYTAPDGATAIGGLTSGQYYYAIVDSTADSTTDFRLAATYEDAITSGVVATTGNTALTSVVDVDANTVTVADHGLSTGDRVTYANGGGTSIVGLTTTATYYVIKSDDNTFQLATSKARALAGQAVDLLDEGVGASHTFTKDAGTEIDLTSAGVVADTHGFERVSNEIVLTANSDHEDLDLTDVAVSTQRLGASATAVAAGDVVRTAGVDTSAGSTESYAMTFAAGMQMSAGDSLTIGGLRFTASANLNRDQIVAAFASLADGSTYGQGLEYGSYQGALRGYASGSASSGALTFTASSAGTNVDDLVVGAEATKANITVSGDDSNVINFATTAKLGTADIGISVQRYSEAGVLTMTANDDTGIGGTSQSIDLGTIAAGASKHVNFDKLGVSFSLQNDSGAAITSTDFEVKGSAVSSLTLDSANDGAAMFQVGAGTRDTVNIDGFRDIRIGDFNKNADNTVFTEIADTLSDIEGGDLDPVTTFATLENQIDAMIGEVSGFRSYLGAQQNRLDHTVAAVQAQSDNITAANSRIQDTDYAAETANLTKTQIMQQAATAMLAQANQMPNVILALLK